MKYIADKLKWASNLKLGDLVEDEHLQVQKIKHIEDCYEFRDPAWFQILISWNNFTINILKKIFEKRILIDRDLYFTNGNWSSAIHNCDSIEYRN